jgi:hypothetical protein
MAKNTAKCNLEQLTANSTLSKVKGWDIGRGPQLLIKKGIPSGTKTGKQTHKLNQILMRYQSERANPYQKLIDWI